MRRVLSEETVRGYEGIVEDEAFGPGKLSRLSSAMSCSALYI
jgi:hypothetical protein